MVRHYKRKNNLLVWSDAQMQSAIDNVNSGKSVASSAKKFGVPRSTPIKNKAAQ